MKLRICANQRTKITDILANQSAAQRQQGVVHEIHDEFFAQRKALKRKDKVQKSTIILNQNQSKSNEIHDEFFAQRKALNRKGKVQRKAP